MNADSSILQVALRGSAEAACEWQNVTFMRGANYASRAGEDELRQPKFDPDQQLSLDQPSEERLTHAKCLSEVARLMRRKAATAALTGCSTSTTYIVSADFHRGRGSFHDAASSASEPDRGVGCHCFGGVNACCRFVARTIVASPIAGIIKSRHRANYGQDCAMFSKLATA